MGGLLVHPAPESFHPSLGIPLITTLRRCRCLQFRCRFPSLFRDSSDHHAALIPFKAGVQSIGFHPSLGIPLITTGAHGDTGTVANPGGFHPSLGIPLITTTTVTPTPEPTRWGFHPSLGIPLITTLFLSYLLDPPFTLTFPSLFRDSSDHHALVILGVRILLKSFHPSLGIPLITTLKMWRISRKSEVSFHPSLGIPLITTRGFESRRPHSPSCFHPSLGIPLITTRGFESRRPHSPSWFPSLFRDSSDHHPLQSLRQKSFIPPNLNYKNSTIKCLLLKSTI